MADNLLKTTRFWTSIRWKDFDFPVSITEFKISEPAKIATYEYAGRNGAEHERVLNYRVFSIAGIFINWAWTKTPEFYAQKLRLLNDNKPWILMHSSFWNFNCIMKSLDIVQSGDDYMPDKSIQQSYSFSMELWEHTPPNARTLQDSLNQLFPAATRKPPSDYYSSSLKYKNSWELFDALVLWNIIAGIDPIKNSEWLRYDYAMRKEAYDKYQDYLLNGAKTKTTKSYTEEKLYTVVSGDYWIKIAKKFNIDFTSLFEANKWKKVRTFSWWTEGYYWKTTWKLYPWDKLIIPPKK